MIVADADVMLACPPNYEEIKRGSGTWATIKFARKSGKPLAIVYPDGGFMVENWTDLPEFLGIPEEIEDKIGAGRGGQSI